MNCELDIALPFEGVGLMLLERHERPKKWILHQSAADFALSSTATLYARLADSGRA